MPPPDPILPPLLTGHAVKAPRVPFAEACRRAAARELGAGDVVWGRGLDQAALAIVLEPEVDAGRCLQMMLLMAVAAGHALAQLLPPQMPLAHRWPDRLLLDGAEVGRLALAHAEAADPLRPPDWLVVGVAITLRFSKRDREPGEMAGRTALAESGGGGLDRTVVIEMLAAHLLSWLDTWQHAGFRPAHDAYLDRLEGRGGMVQVSGGGGPITGTPLGLDEEAGLLLRTPAGPVRSVALRDALAAGQCTAPLPLAGRGRG
jgi:biotin-(acetyl-CoA carboxylase) ligase